MERSPRARVRGRQSERAEPDREDVDDLALATSRFRVGRVPPRVNFKSVLAVVVSGVALYGLAPQLIVVLGDWPKLRDIEPGWFVAMALTEGSSLLCMCTVQRIATREHRWAPFLHSYLAANAVSQLVPGGAATAGALQYEMLGREGITGGRALSGLAAGSVIVLGSLLALNTLSLPLVALGASVPSQLLAAAWISVALLINIGLTGWAAFRDDRLVTAIGRAAQWAINRLRRNSPDVHGIPERLLAQRAALRDAVGRQWRRALLAASGKWLFDYLTLVFALAAIGQHPNLALVLAAYTAVTLIGQLPLTPGGLGVVEAGLTGALVLVGVSGGAAVLATLAYRLYNYWLYLPAGVIGLVLHRRAIRNPAPRTESPL